MFRWIVWRDLILAWRRRANVLSTVFFFVIVVSLFPLGIGPETQLLRLIAPGVVWVAALLASMLSLGRMFENDYQDGTLEQMLLTPQPLYLVVLGKIAIPSESVRAFASPFEAVNTTSRFGTGFPFIPLIQIRRSGVFS